MIEVVIAAMPPETEWRLMNGKQTASTLCLLALALISLYFCYLIAKPFLSPIFLAVMIAIVFHPVHARIQARIQSRNGAALLSTVLVLIALVVPSIALGTVISREIGQLYQLLSLRSGARGGWNPYVMHALDGLVAWVGRWIDLDAIDVRGNLLRWLEQVSRVMFAWGTHVVSNIVSFIAAAMVMFFTLFFLFREGVLMRTQLVRLVPLKSEQVERLFTGISNSIIANVYGCVAVGIAQGFLTSVAFWALAVPSPVLWGVVTAMFSLIPIVGSAAVWGPAAIVLLASGHWVKALILLGWGTAVVGQIDSLVRPYVISGKAKLHTLLVFFALLGGVQAFGVMGLFIGPVVLSITLVVLQMLQEENHWIPAS